MASRRVWLVLATQVGVFSAGAAAALAWQADLAANGLLLTLVGLALVIWGAAQVRRTQAPPPAEPVPAPERLVRELRTLQAYLDQVPTPLVTLRAAGPPRAENRTARRLFRTDDALTGDLAEEVAAALAGSPDTRRTIRLVSGDVPRTYTVAIAEVAGAGEPLRLGAFTDIDAEIQAAEASALRDLLRVLSHEIMNSLTPLASLAQTAAEALDDPARPAPALARDALGVIARRTDSLNRFIDGYRRLARLPQPSPRPVSLGTLLIEAAQLFKSRWTDEGVGLIVDPPAPDIVIQLDPDLTAQALINLLTNAAEAALAGDAPQVVRLSARLSGDGALIVVEDNGPGVDEAHRANIFQPFFTTKPTGSGIGLSLARQAAVSQGGQLLLEPSERGARFVLAF